MVEPLSATLPPCALKPMTAVMAMGSWSASTADGAEGERAFNWRSVHDLGRAERVGLAEEIAVAGIFYCNAVGAVRQQCGSDAGLTVEQRHRFANRGAVGQEPDHARRRARSWRNGAQGGRGGNIGPGSSRIQR